LIDQMLSSIKLRPNIILEVEAMPTTLRLVEIGVGYTILSYSSVHHLVKAERIKVWPLVNPGFTRQLILATSTQRPTTVPSRALADIVREEVKKLGELLSMKHDVARQNGKSAASAQPRT
jgi:LysR family nitrogen assimilation transcriptional regulator